MTEDKLARLLAAAADQLRGQNDGVAATLAAYSVRVRDLVVRKDIARQVSNLFSGIGGLGGTVVRREGVADADATRALDKTLQELREVVTAELTPPFVEHRKVVDARKLLVMHREIPGVGLRAELVGELSVTPGPVSAGPGTLVMEFAAALPSGVRSAPLIRLTFVGVAEHTFLAEGFGRLSEDTGGRQRLIELFDSDRLRQIRQTGGPMEALALGLRHFRVGFAAHGDYDVLCRDLRIDRLPSGEQLDELTPRANEFLRRHASRYVPYVDPAEDRQDAMRTADRYRLPFNTVMTKLADLRRRYGGLRYQSLSWSFDEIIEFSPELDLDDEDPEPMVSLLEHSAQPYGVWATLDGVVHFMYAGGEYVHVFDRIESIIESDALMAEWIEVSRGGGDTIDLMETELLSRPVDQDPLSG